MANDPMDGSLYIDDQFGNGVIASDSITTINSATAAEAIGFGQAVNLNADNQVVTAKSAPIYGIAAQEKSGITHGFTFENVATDTFQAGEAVSVVRDGTVYVPVSADVNAGEPATVDADGNFKPAGSSDKPVGLFRDSANAGGTARVQIRIDLNAKAQASSTTPTSTPTSGSASGSTGGAAKSNN